MTSTLLAVFLVALVGAARGGLLGWLEGEEQAQADQPQQAQSDASEVLRVVEELSRNFIDLAGQRGSWLQRYDALANDSFRNSAIITELLGISRIAMPIIWNTYSANLHMQRAQKLAEGGAVSYNPTQALPAPHPLQSLTTELTDQDDYTFEVTLKLNEEANVGLRIMYEPEEGQEFDWDNDDILVGVHLRWHFKYGNDREVVLASFEGGEWSPEFKASEEKWPNLVVGEKFSLVVSKKGSCVQLFVLMGGDIAFQIPKLYFPFTYCPQPRRQSKMAQFPRRLRMVVNEDEPGTGQLEVYGITWYPGSVL